MTMVLRDGDSSSKPKKSLEDLMESGSGNLISKINKLKKKIEAERKVQIKEKMEKNKEKLQSHICGIQSVPLEVNTSLVDNTSVAPQLGLEKQGILLNGLDPGLGDKDLGSIQEVVFLKSTKLPKVQSIPRYTTWIFLDRNQRMSEDQSVVGRRRIYYDQTGNEALLCSDSEDDMAEIEEEKRDFSEGEDRILWMAFMEHGSDNNVAEVVSHFIGGNSSEIQERFNELKLKYEESQEQGSSGKNLFLEKSLSTALDSFDNLFCRRCLVFDCRLHGCSQNLVYPSEKPLSLSEPEITKPCSDQCYLLVEGSQTSSLLKMNRDLRKRVTKGSKVLSIRDKVSSQDVGVGCTLESSNGDGQPSNVIKRKITIDNNNSDISESSENCVDKKMKKIRALEHLMDGNNTRNSNNDIHSQISSSHRAIEIVEIEENDSNERHELEEPAVSLAGQREDLFNSSEWRPLEKDLYLKGLEIFGSSSCLIARNLLSGLKTCSEVSNYMCNNMTHNMENARSSDDISRANSDNLDEETPMRSRIKLVRKRGRTRRLKYSSKSNGHPSSWKRIGGGEHSRKQYTPCSCKKTCGRDCSCLNNGSCCEKYCGCDKSCKNRFRGCHCGKGQCKSRQCPCFAANRECDPDVCRNCWVSCGGDSLGEPPKRGDGLCENMKLLLRQQQRILLGRSDVAGWGAFIKNSVNKNDYLGEYTGELISHREADKRGKIYDRANSSFLFDLNDEYVLDACRQGDKLKFANHSSKPNCYCKIMLVGGDHRVGIFAGERIEAGQELFYDYRYGPEQAPVWARRPESSKTDDLPPSQGRPRKHQSRGVQ